MDDISTSFCFICLLHLANERGLSIDVGESGGDAEEGDNVVGDIWGLKVCYHFMTMCSEIDVHSACRCLGIQMLRLKSNITIVFIFSGYYVTLSFAYFDFVLALIVCSTCDGYGTVKYTGN
jgi:hypothetical protein